MGIIHLGISACLLGKNMRYDGGHKYNPILAEFLGKYFEYLPICPEVECGLGVPREAGYLEGEAASPRFITIGSRIDLTERLTEWSIRRARELEQEPLAGFVFKSRSPSCGLGSALLYKEGEATQELTHGIFARIFTQHFPQAIVLEEEGLNTAKISRFWDDLDGLLGRRPQQHKG